MRHVAAGGNCAWPRLVNIAEEDAGGCERVEPDPSSAFCRLSLVSQRRDERERVRERKRERSLLNPII